MKKLMSLWCVGLWGGSSLLFALVFSFYAQASELRTTAVQQAPVVKSFLQTGQASKACQQSGRLRSQTGDFASTSGRPIAGDTCNSVQSCNDLIADCLAYEGWEFIDGSFDPNTGAPNSGLCQVGC